MPARPKVRGLSTDTRQPSLPLCDELPQTAESPCESLYLPQPRSRLVDDKESEIWRNLLPFLPELSSPVYRAVRSLWIKLDTEYPIECAPVLSGSQSTESLTPFIQMANWPVNIGKGKVEILDC